MRQLKARIAQNKRIADPRTFTNTPFSKGAGVYTMRIESPYLAKNIKPGQFIEVLVSGALDPLLRRPLGAHRILKDGMEVLYEVVGKGTAILSEKRPGEYLDVIGPLGNGFDVRCTKDDVRSTILIAGGIGIAPLLALAEELVHSVEHIAYRKKMESYVLIGACSKNHILCEKDFIKLGYKVFVSTEDGSKGRKGVVTNLLKDILSAKRYPLNATIYACGPNAMHKAIWDLAKGKGIPCQFSFESRMACGVGVCLGCPIKVRKSNTMYDVRCTNYDLRSTNYEYKMVCKDGPVFNADEVFW